MIGSECTNETEPYIVSLALAEQQVWEGADGKSWMGTITEGWLVSLSLIISFAQAGVGEGLFEW